MIRATPFHARTAEANRANLWMTRNRFTLPLHFGDPAVEVAAARFGVVMGDISWRWRVMLEGARTRELVQRVFTRDAAVLNPGQALKALWLSDGGGVRGAGVVARHGRQSFQLVAAAEDAAWIASAASLFGVTARDVTDEEGGLALIGPHAARLIAALGLDAALEPLSLRKFLWRGLEVTLSRFGEQGGYEIWCKSEDASLLWDRVAHAGEAFALLPAGQAALDTLDLEAGVPRPGRDYDGASAAHTAEPLAGELRLASLIDPDHPTFNGRAAALAAKPRLKLVGLAFDSAVPAPFTPVLANGAVVGRTLSSGYSPILRRAIALAQIDEAHAAPGTRLSLNLSASRDVLLPTVAAVSVVDLPFLAPPELNSGMKHAGPKALDGLEPLLKKLRGHAELKEKSRGCFYLRGRGFLHFHEHGVDELYADIGLGDDFERLPAMTAAQHKVILKRTATVLADGNRLAKR